MKKSYLAIAAAAMTLGVTSCSNDDNLSAEVQSQAPALADGSIGFDAYIQRGVTRSGFDCDVTGTGLRSTSGVGAQGFGVFGFYTDNKEYDQLYTPNFMYNQKVYWDDTNKYFTYTPVKYWPNEYGTSAQSEDNDKVSFFAYAPYVSVDAKSGKATDQTFGITSMNRNTASGDPIIKYIGSFDNMKAVDLCWGVNPADNLWGKVVDGQYQTSLEDGMPWLNVERPQEAATQAAAAQRVKFQFKHALAKMQVSINYVADAVSGTGQTIAADQTRIFVRSVKFSGFTMKGALNLNNTDKDTPYWLNYNGIGDLVADSYLTVYDGRKDGKEAMTGADATNEKVQGLNKELVENDGALTGTAWATGAKPGVTATAVNLFEKSEGATGDYFYVIPTGDDMEIEIVYDVETIDANLAGKLADNATNGSAIQNCIKKTIKFGDVSKLEAGKAYVINLHLGMNSVKFDANVQGWDDPMNADVDLPANAPVFAANAADLKAVVPYNATSYEFILSDLTGGEAVTGALATSKEEKTGNDISAAANFATAAWEAANGKATGITANTSGNAYVNLTTTENKSTSNRTIIGTWSTNKPTSTAITFTQAAHPLGLTVVDKKAADKYQLKLASELTYGFFSLGYSMNCAAIPVANNRVVDNTANPLGNGIEVYRNGTKLTLVDSETIANNTQYKFDNAGLITLKEAVTEGDVIKVVLKTGDAPEETVTWTVTAATSAP